MNRSGRTTLLGALALMAACVETRPPAADHDATPATTARPVNWDYVGDEGPAHWADLSPAYAVCRDGREQSPIDLVAMRTDSGVALGRTYESAAVAISFNEQAVDLLDNGHTIQVDYEGGDTLTIDGIAYALRQFHFHAPSEHAVAGRQFPLEVHLVHQSPTGELAVIGIFVTEGAPHPGAAELIELLPHPGETTHFEDVVLDLEGLIPDEEQYFRYEGSLTTPPCSEGVHWFVMATPIEASRGQLDTLAAVLDGNNRPLQPRGDREVLLVVR